MSKMTTQKTPWIVEAQADTFQQEVVDRSRELPVVVDFWAQWCQPCRLLAPILEKLAVEYGGKFLLVKADTDRLPDAATQFGVQSIPAVYGLRGGELVDMFVGVLSETQIRAWLDRLLPSPAELLLAEARPLEAIDPAGAEAKYRQAIELAPELAAARIALATLLVSAASSDEGRTSEARALIDQLSGRGFLEPEAQRVKALLDLEAHGLQAGGLDECRAAAEAEPGNMELQLKLAESLAAHGEYATALELALRIVETDRKQSREPARKLMIDIFQLLPGDSELTSAFRRKLSMALY
jgi:putative thioredoxin